MTRERADEIFEAAKARAIHGPWSDQLDKVMTADERAEVIAFWKRIPSGSSTFVSALFRIRDGIPAEKP